MSDLISRQALCDYALNQKDKSVTPNDIMRFPSAQPEQRWIPYSERLPEMGSTVLMQNTGGWMFVATYAVTPKRKYWAALEHDYALDEAIAWMPLPEPYKAESEDKNANR